MASSIAENEKISDEQKIKLENDLDEWKTIAVDIAVIGESGSGKSSFINKFRGLNPKDHKHKKDSEGKSLWAAIGTYN